VQLFTHGEGPAAAFGEGLKRKIPFKRRKSNAYSLRQKSRQRRIFRA
jgi:hypothetical protein